ncbi:MAG: ribbon-helix-helix protein, CopG family [Candidatus Omnitrophica bacterium]|nr:ribbon-helix-helix protein, CopG family [Candidatus Omnitrophota bacterium]
MIFAVDRQARKERVSRSALIQKAIRSYLGVSRCEELRPLLKGAYRELREES